MPVVLSFPQLDHFKMESGYTISRPFSSDTIEEVPRGVVAASKDDAQSFCETECTARIEVPCANQKGKVSDSMFEERSTSFYYYLSLQKVIIKLIDSAISAASQSVYSQ